jgi:hypothetical protein
MSHTPPLVSSSPLFWIVCMLLKRQLLSVSRLRHPSSTVTKPALWEGRLDSSSTSSFTHMFLRELRTHMERESR